MIISNSFATHLHALEAAGEEARFEEYNRRAVELGGRGGAEAGREDALVAAGVSYWSWRGDMPTADSMREAATPSALDHGRGGADIIFSK